MTADRDVREENDEIEEMAIATHYGYGMQIISEGKEPLLQPFTERIELCRGEIYGMAHYDDIRQRIEGLKIGDQVLLIPGLKKKYSPTTVEVLTKEEVKLGRLSHNCEVPIYHLLKAGKEITGEISRMRMDEFGNPYSYGIELVLYMKD